MGEEIATFEFDSADFCRFAARLEAETALVGELFADRALAESGFSLGFEIEAWLLDHAYFPTSGNEAFLAAIDHPLVVPELSRFNVELNCTPQPLTGDVFTRMAAEIEALWAHCEQVAHGLDSNLVAIGTLPVICDEDLRLDNISPQKRYRALNDELLRQRRGEPVRVVIDGRESLVSQHFDVMLEAATTSFQIHLKTPASLAHHYWNASAMIAGPLLAGATNAPFLFGRDLWDETRIPLFEQSVNLPHSSLERVGFGRGYVGSLLELFRENSDHPVLLPLDYGTPVTALRHFRLHNGTIWRWTRPLIDFEADGTAHLRIEHRSLPSGPSVLDMLANTAAYVGLIHEIVQRGEAEVPTLAFSAARRNFYESARLGLEAELTWPGLGAIGARRLLSEQLVPLARAGLARLGIGGDGEGYLDLYEQRVRHGLTGTVWQRRSLARNAGDFSRMMADYCEQQRSANPVCQWAL